MTTTAAFIVRACNAHEALLAALVLAERQLRSWHIGTRPASRVDVRVQEAIDAARAAIRKAQEG